MVAEQAVHPLCEECRQRGAGPESARHRQVHVRAHGKESCERRMRDRLEAAISAQPEPTDDARREGLASARRALNCLTVAIQDRR